MAPTVRTVTMEKIGFTPVRDGQVVEGWYYGDELMFLNTLGAVSVAFTNKTEQPEGERP